MACPKNFLFCFTTGEPQCECTGNDKDKSEDETIKEDDKEPEEVENEEEEDTEDKEPKTVDNEEEEEEAPYTCECNAYNFGKLTLAREDNGGIVVTNADGKKANLLVENILANNGVIHLIDRVLF